MCIRDRARTSAVSEAEALAQERGAWGAVSVVASVQDMLASDVQGAEIYLGTTVTARAQSGYAELE